MALNKEELLKVKGETGALLIKDILGAIIDEVNAINTNVNTISTNVNTISTKTQNMTADENGTYFALGVFANNNEITADDEYHPTVVENTSSGENTEGNA